MIQTFGKRVAIGKQLWFECVPSQIQILNILDYSIESTLKSDWLFGDSP